MEIDDAELLRELRRALDAAVGQGQDAQAVALSETLRRYGATMADLARALRTARARQRGREIHRLVAGLGRLADQREEAEETADAVDRFLRGLNGEGRA